MGYAFAVAEKAVTLLEWTVAEMGSGLPLEMSFSSLGHILS